MAIELQGFDDLKNDLTNMAYALDQGPGVNRALKAGAVPIEQQMLHNASTDPKIITDALLRTMPPRKERPLTARPVRLSGPRSSAPMIPGTRLLPMRPTKK